MPELVLTLVIFVATGVTSTALYGAISLGLHRAGVRVQSPRERRVSIVALVLFALGCVCFLEGLLVEPRRIEVTSLTMESAKLPRGTRLRIAHVSDLHLGVGAPAAAHVAALVNAHAPDVLVFTGDAVNDDASEPALHAIFAAIETKTGRFAVRGNHDRSVELGPSVVELTGEPVALLEGRIALCGAAFGSLAISMRA